MSGRKNALKKFPIILAGDMSQSLLTSVVTNIEYLDNVGVQFNFTDSPTGTFSVEVSVDYEQDSLGNVTNTGNWVPIQFPSTPVASGSAGSVYCDVNQISAPWIRVKYTKTSGTGSLDAFICAKMV